MFLASPAFAFLFLPLALLFYATLGKSNRPFSLLFISICYQLLMLYVNPAVPVCFAFLIVYCFVADRLLHRWHRRTLLLGACILPFCLLIAIRYLTGNVLTAVPYPYGFSFGVLCAVSFLSDSYHGYVEDKRSLFHVARYLLFFPIMTAGPVISYRHFAHLSEERHICFHLHNFSMGARLYMIGFIKHVAVGAVFLETYDTVVNLGTFSPNLFVSLISLIFVFFAVYFTITGYAEMGTGIARMLGLRVRVPFSAPLSNATPKHYLNHFFASLGNWITTYIISPFPRLTQKEGRVPRFLRCCVYCFFLSFFLRSEWYMLPITLPLILISYWMSAPAHIRAIRKQSGLRVLSSLITLLVIAVYWALILSGGIGEFWRYVLAIRTDNMEYRFSLLVAAFSNVKYILVLVIAILMLLPYFKSWRHMLRTLSEKKLTVLNMVWLFALLAFFLFSILFFLPQYPQYSFMPYMYLKL